MAKKAPPEQWQNRIVGYGEESPEDLLANPLNFRIHSKHQQDALLGALEEVGIVQDVLVNKDTGFLVDGHLRVTLAMRTGQATIPVKYVSLSEHEERLILATFDPISALATTDAQKLDELLHEVSTGSAAIQQMLDDMASKAGLYAVDPTEEWQGMPEFEQEDVGAAYSIKVNFLTFEDLIIFGRLIEQTVTKDTRSVWYPMQSPLDGKKYVAHES